MLFLFIAFADAPLFVYCPMFYKLLSAVGAVAAIIVFFDVISPGGVLGSSESGYTHLFICFCSIHVLLPGSP